MPDPYFEQSAHTNSLAAELAGSSRRTPIRPRVPGWSPPLVRPVRLIEGALLKHSAKTTNFNPVGGAFAIRSADGAGFVEEQLILRFDRPIPILHKIEIPIGGVKVEVDVPGSVGISTLLAIEFALLTIPLDSGPFDLSTIDWAAAYFKSAFSLESVVSSLYATASNFIVPSALPIGFDLESTTGQSDCTDGTLHETDARQRLRTNNTRGYHFTATEKALMVKPITGIHFFMGQGFAAGTDISGGGDGSTVANFTVDPALPSVDHPFYLGYPSPFPTGL